MSSTFPIPANVPEGGFPPGTYIGGRYVVLRELGAGATGAVYEVHDAVLPERRLALKILHQPPATLEERDEQREELRSMVKVRHPSIIALYDHGDHQGRLYSVLPLMRGDALDGRTFPRAEVHRIGVMLSQALAAMHEIGLTHQDVKPENARLTVFDGVPKPVPILLDLGTAVRVGTPLRGFSPAFLAPEIARTLLANEQRPLADPKADVYSMAATLHALLELPEDDDSQNLLAFLAKRAEGRTPTFRNPRLRFLDRHFARWMANDPADRPTAAELAQELDVLLRPERLLRRAARVGLVVTLLGAVLGYAFVQVQKANRATVAARAHAAELARDRSLAERRASQAEVALGSTRGALEQASGRVDLLTQDAARLMAEANKETDRAETWETRARRYQKSLEAIGALVTELRAALADERRLRESLTQQVSQRDAQLANAAELQRETEQARRAAASEAETLTGQLAALEDERRRLLGQLEASRAEVARERETHAQQLAAARTEAERAEAARGEATEALDACKRRLDACVAGSGSGSGSGGGGEPATP